MNHLEAHMCVLQELNDAIACMGTLNPKIRKRGLCHVRASNMKIDLIGIIFKFQLSVFQCDAYSLIHF